MPFIHLRPELLLFNQKMASTPSTDRLEGDCSTTELFCNPHSLCPDVASKLFPVQKYNTTHIVFSAAKPILDHSFVSIRHFSRRPIQNCEPPSPAKARTCPLPVTSWLTTSLHDNARFAVDGELTVGLFLTGLRPGIILVFRTYPLLSEAGCPRRSGLRG